MDWALCGTPVELPAALGEWELCTVRAFLGRVFVCDIQVGPHSLQAGHQCGNSL